MTSIPRKTLFLAILLVLVLIGAAISAFHSASHPDDDVYTHVVHTMVATMNGMLQRIGVVPATRVGVVTERGGPSIAWLLGLGLVAVWIVRDREPDRQQQSRNKRS